jgi:hypothetical protein
MDGPEQRGNIGGGGGCTQRAPDAAEMRSSSLHLSARQDFVAGCVAGACSTFVGHPFDTVKVRLQLSTHGVAAGMTPLQCARWTVQTEGAQGLYRGLASPMVSVPLVNAVVFSSYGQAKELLQGRHPATALTATEGCLAGAWAGLVNTSVVTPVELLKCRLQVCSCSCSCTHTMKYLRSCYQQRNQVTTDWRYPAGAGPRARSTVRCGGRGERAGERAEIGNS